MSAAPVDNIIGYHGYVFNNESQQYTVRFRTYDPALGRFITRDPAGYVDGASLYEFAASSPALFTDPFGLNVNDPIYEAWAYEQAAIVLNLRNGRITLEAAQAFMEASSQYHQMLLHGVDEAIARRKAARTIGPYRAAMGIIETVGGLAMVAGTGGVAIGVGVPVTIHGIDNAWAGIYGTITGEEYDTVTQRCATHLTGSEEAGFWIDFGIGVIDLPLAIGAIVRNLPDILQAIGKNWDTVVARLRGRSSIPTGIGTSSSAIRRVGEFLESPYDVLKNPLLLKGKSPIDIQGSIGNAPGWRVEALGKGSHKGEGWVLRQYDANGLPTGNLIRWHPGGGHHGPQPYWVVSSPEGGKVRIGQ